MREDAHGPVLPVAVGHQLLGAELAQLGQVAADGVAHVLGGERRVAVGAAVVAQCVETTFCTRSTRPGSAGTFRFPSVESPVSVTSIESLNVVLVGLTAGVVAVGT